MKNLAGKTVLQATFLNHHFKPLQLFKTSKTNIKMSFLVSYVIFVFKYLLKVVVILKVHMLLKCQVRRVYAKWSKIYFKLSDFQLVLLISIQVIASSTVKTD